MGKIVRKRQLVGRLFVTMELRPLADESETEGFSHEVEIENTTTLVYDALVNTKVVKGVPAEGQNGDEIQHRFLGLLDAAERKSQVLSFDEEGPNSIKTHTYKLSHKSDIAPDWIEDLIDPVIELTGGK